MSVLLRITVLLCLSTFLCTCGPALENAAEPTVIVGNIRYDETLGILEATLTVSPVPPTAPAVLGNILSPIPGMSPGHFRNRMKMEFPSAIDLSVPGHPGQVIRLSAPFPDSIPTVLSKSRTAKITAMKTSLSDTESLVFFLEPEDRSTPKRILLQGPSNTGTLTLPKESIADVSPGKYQAYFVRQQLQKDSSATLETSLQTEYFTRPVPVEVKE